MFMSASVRARMQTPLCTSSQPGLSTTTRFTRTRHSDIVHPVSSSQLTEARDRVRSFGGYNIEEMHEGVKNSRDLVVLFTRDYEQSPYTRMEFTSFEANAAQSTENRHMVILRCEDAPLLGLFAPHVYQDLVGIADAEERRSRLLAAAEGRSQALEPPPRPFIGVPPRI